MKDNKKFMAIGSLVITVAAAVIEYVKVINEESIDDKVNRLIDEKLAEREIKYENDLK